MPEPTNSPMPTPISRQAGQGALALLTRHAITFPLGILSSIVLARLLTPTDFGTFATASTLVMTLGSFFEMGIGAAVIQQTRQPEPSQLQDIFSTYLLVYGTLSVMVMLIATFLASTFNLGAHGHWLIMAMSLHMLLGTFGAVPALLLERDLRFGAIAHVDLIHVVVDRLTCISFAWYGLGAWSFILASLLAAGWRIWRLNQLAPWPIRFRLNRRDLAQGLWHGAPFQGVNLLALARENLITLQGGLLFGPSAVGLLNWGSNLAGQVPQNALQIASRVNFPAFARLHDAVEARRNLLFDSMALVNLVVWPTLVVIAVNGDGLIHYLYGEAWRPAQFALTLFCLRLALMTWVNPAINYLNAIGSVRLSLRVAFLWTAAEWGLAALLAPRWGFNAIAIASAAGILVPCLATGAVLRKEGVIPWQRISAWPILLAGLGAGLVWLLRPWVQSTSTLLATVALEVGVLAILWIWRSPRSLWQHLAVKINPRETAP